MNKRFAHIAAALALAVSLPAGASGIPVIDGANLGQSMMNHIESVAKYVEQIDQLKSQLAQLEKQYKAITGSRGLGQILMDPRFRQYLPEEWKSVYDAVRRGGYPGLNGDAKGVLDAIRKYDACANMLVATEKSTCEALASKGVQDKVFYEKAFDLATERVNQIEGLMQKISTTEDQKAIAELQARIAIEQASLQNEHTKLQMFGLIQQAEQRILEQQAHEDYIKWATTTEMPVLIDIDWRE